MFAKWIRKGISLAVSLLKALTKHSGVARMNGYSNEHFIIQYKCIVLLKLIRT